MLVSGCASPYPVHPGDKVIIVPLLYVLLGVLMVALFALLLWGVIDHKTPTDGDIAARIEALLNTQLHPRVVQVAVHRHSRFTTRLETLDITLKGFSADNLPFGMPAPAATAPSSAPTAPPAAPNGDAGLPNILTGDVDGAPTSFTTPKREQQMQIGSLHLICEDVTLKGLPVQALDLTMTEVVLPVTAVRAGQFTIATVESTGGTLTMSEGGLTRYLRTLPLPISNPQVRISPGGVWVTGGLKAFLNAPVELQGALAARNRAVLYLDHPTLHVLKVPVPGFATDAALKQIDPITDLNSDLQLPVPLVISNVAHLEHCLRFTATLLFPKATAAP